MNGKTQGREYIFDKDCTPTRIHLRPPWVRHQFFLLQVVAAAQGGQAFLIDQRGIALLGSPHHDHARTLTLFHCLNQHQQHILYSNPLPSRHRAYRPSFMLGYAHHLAQALPLTQTCPLPLRPPHPPGYRDGMIAASNMLATPRATLVGKPLPSESSSADTKEHHEHRSIS